MNIHEQEGVYEQEQKRLLGRGTLSVVDVIGIGAVYALERESEAWEYIDGVIIPVFREKLREVSKASTYKDVCDLLVKFLQNENPDFRDYGGTVATAVFEEMSYCPSTHGELFLTLEYIAHNDSEVFPRFRASTALAEAGRVIVADSGLETDTLLENLEKGAEADQELEEAAGDYREKLERLKRGLQKE